MTHRLKVVVAGTGVAGSILARILARRPDVELICVDKVDRDDHSEAGTGLNICPNGLKAVHLLDPHLARSLADSAASLPWRRWTTKLTDGTVLFDLDLAAVADRPGLRIRWSALYDILRAPIAGFVRWRTAVDDVRVQPDGRLTLALSSAVTGDADIVTDIDLLIAADGRYSAVRQAVLGPPEPRHYGIAIYRLLVDDTADGLITDYEQWFNGPNRLLAYQVQPEKIYIAGSFPLAAGEEIEEYQKTAGYLARAYTPERRPPSAQCRWLIDTICAHAQEIHWARVQDIDDAWRDPGGRVLILGDGAHAMVPTLGQGATQALEDAGLVGLMLQRALDDAGAALDVPALTAHIETVRRPRLDFVKRLSIDATDTMFSGADPIAGARWKTEPGFLGDLRRLYDTGV